MHPSRNIDVYPIKFCVEKNLRLWKCGVYELSQLDDELAVAYDQALGCSGLKRNKQTAWLKVRNKCNCVHK
jgi:uncharacterized protein